MKCRAINNMEDSMFLKFKFQKVESQLAGIHVHCDPKRTVQAGASGERCFGSCAAFAKTGNASGCP